MSQLNKNFVLDTNYTMIWVKDSSGTAKGVVLSLLEGDSFKTFELSGLLWKVTLLIGKYQYSTKDAYENILKGNNSFTGELEAHLDFLCSCGIFHPTQQVGSVHVKPLEEEEKSLLFEGNEDSEGFGTLRELDLDSFLDVQGELEAYATGCCGCGC